MGVTCSGPMNSVEDWRKREIERLGSEREGGLGGGGWVRLGKPH